MNAEETRGAPAQSVGKRVRGEGTQISRRTFLLFTGTAALAACSSTSPAPPPVGLASTPSSTQTVRTPSPVTAAPAATAARTESSGVASEVAHGNRRTKAVALTFHGAGDPRLAEAILSVAEKAGASLTVLAVGTWLQNNPAMGTRILRAGHELGNHTLHHRPMRLMSESEAYAEIIGGRHVVERYTAEPSWFRPSGTPRATTHILAAAGRAGYTTSLSFDVDPQDYSDPGPGIVTSRVLARARPGSIISLHLGHAGTVAALPAILRGLHSRGLACVSVSGLLPGINP